MDTVSSNTPDARIQTTAPWNQLGILITIKLLVRPCQHSRRANYQTTRALIEHRKHGIDILSETVTAFKLWRCECNTLIFCYDYRLSTLQRFFQELDIASYSCRTLMAKLCSRGKRGYLSGRMQFHLFVTGKCWLAPSKFCSTSLGRFRSLLEKITHYDRRQYILAFISVANIHGVHPSNVDVQSNWYGVNSSCNEVFDLYPSKDKSSIHWLIVFDPRSCEVWDLYVQMSKRSPWMNSCASMSPPLHYLDRFQVFGTVKIEMDTLELRQPFPPLRQNKEGSHSFEQTIKFVDYLSPRCRVSVPDSESPFKQKS